MSRQARWVPKDWEHPKDENGEYVPLLDHAFFVKLVACWDEGAHKWTEGFRSDHEGGWIPLTEEEKKRSYEECEGERPDPECYMPLWREDECGYLMMYEETSQGTPISPAFPTAEELARWLVDNEAYWFGDQTASYEIWLATIKNPTNPWGVVFPDPKR